MSNVTPIHSGGEPPSSLPPPSRKQPRKRIENEIGLKFTRGKGDISFRAFTGLKGVVHALYSLEGVSENLDDFMRLSIAAALLIDVLEEHQS